MQIDEILYDLGMQKENGELSQTWEQLALRLNAQSGENHTESYWRKKYKTLKLHNELLAATEDLDFAQNEEEEVMSAIEQTLHENMGTDRRGEYENRTELQSLKDERLGLNRAIREMARSKRLEEVIQECVEALPKNQHRPVELIETDSNRVTVALLSDIHYGLEYESFAGKYSPEIAESRMMYYRDRIISKARMVGSNVLYFVLAGDLISGGIHTTVQAQNRDNVVNQTTKVSELIATMVHDFGDYFDKVYVYSVYGNHSRLDPNVKNTLRDERLDKVPMWYMKAALRDYSNVKFVTNEVDGSITTFSINNRNFACVHGDLDKNLKTSVSRIESVTRTHIDYMLSGHTHVAEVRYDQACYITNGCLCGSGDDYSVSKRLFAGPVQVMFEVEHSGEVEDITFVRF